MLMVIVLDQTQDSDNQTNSNGSKDSQPTMGFETSAGMESSPVPAEPAASDVPKMTTLKHIKLDARHRWVVEVVLVAKCICCD